MLAIRGLTKTYGSTTVLDGVDLELRGGEIHALLGANGAGKSTLCGIVAGLTAPTAGRMRLDDEDYAPAGKREAECRGVQLVSQELNLVPTLSVAENLLLTDLPTVGPAFLRGCGWISSRSMNRRATELLERYGLRDLDPGTPVGRLGVGQRQMVEVAATLAKQGCVVLLDEPTAALGVAETERLLDWLRVLRDGGVAVVYVSHRLAEVQQLADRISVLRDGRLVVTEEMSGVTTDDMVRWMSGDSASMPSSSRGVDRQPRVSGRDRRPGLRVASISSGSARDVSFEVARGERLGLAGLVGSGRSDLLRAIFGADRARSGSVRVGDAPPLRFRSPHEATAAGLGLVTEDRKHDGLLLDLSLRTNVSLSSLARRCADRGVVAGATERQLVRQQVERLDLRCSSIEQRAATLSGGNQQKAVLARWLLAGAEVLLLDEPTRGVDVAARYWVHALMGELADAGTTLVISSSDTEELIETCDRIGVMSKGRLVRIFERDEFDEEQLLEAAFVHHLAPQETGEPRSSRRGDA